MTSKGEFDFASEYQDLWKFGRQAILEKGVAFDPQLLPTNGDSRRGLGLFSWQEDLIPKTQPILDVLHEAFPSEIVLFGHPSSPARQHVTLLELNSVGTDDPRDLAILAAKYQEVCWPVLSKMPPIRATFRGVVASQSAILIKGFPVNNEVNAIREKLRAEIIRAGLPELNRRKVQILHSTIGRFVRSIEDPKKLVALIDSMLDTEIGETVFDNVDLMIASWLMADNQTELIATTHLG